MKHTLPVILSLLLIALVILPEAYGQQKSIVLQSPETTSQDHVARDFIQLKPGYQASGAQGQFNYRLDEKMIFPVETQTPANPERELDKSLAVGSIPGVVDVSSTGAATYTIPIPVPGGTAGMQPQLAIAYNSQGGLGLLGQGWNLLGLSAITRVSQSKYHDGKVNGVNLDHHDRFAMDGNRLIGKTGTYGHAGTTYYTEIESYSQIVALGTSGNGPASFEVTTKNGIKIEYGKNPNSRHLLQGSSTPLAWYISKITDLHGNYIEYIYKQNQEFGECIIDEIRYTGNSLIQPYARVSFLYEEHNSVNIQYVAKKPIFKRLLLRAIKTEYDGKEIDLISFKYSKFFNIQLNEISSLRGNSKFFNSTVIFYGDRSENFKTINNNVTHTKKYFYPGDFNGDGRKDLFVIYKNSSNKWGYWELLISNDNNEFVKKDNGTLSSNFQINDIKIIDYFKNGTNQIVWQKSGKYSYVVSAYHCIRNTPDGPVDDICYNYGQEDRVYFHTYFYNGSLINDPGYDVIFHNDNRKLKYFTGMFQDDDFYPYFILDANNSFVKKNFSTQNLPTFTALDTILVADFSGTGRQSLMVSRPNRTIIYKYDNVSNAFIESYNSSTFLLTKGDFLTGDFNGDRITDILRFNASLNKWELFYFNGESFIAQSNCPITRNIRPSLSLINDNYYVEDINNDGKDDIIETYRNSQNNVIVNIFLSHGRNFETESKVILASPLHLDGICFGDFNADGNVDIIYNSNLDNKFQTLLYREHENMGLVKSIANGMNQRLNFNYTRNNETQLNIINSLGTISTDNTEIKTIYSFKTPMIQKNGIGFLGFEEITSTGPDFKTVNNFGFNPTYYNTYLEKSKTFATSGAQLSEIVITPKVRVVDAQKKVIAPYTSRTVSKDLIKGFTYTTDLEYDTHGNLKLEKVNVSGEFTTETKYLNYLQKGGIMPNMPGTIEVTRVKTGEAGNYQRSKQFTYNDKGQVITEIMDPGKAKAVTTMISYGAFGLPTSTTVSSSGLASRTSSTVYDSRGRHVTKTTNPLGFSSEFTYDPVKDFLLSEKDATGLITTYSYNNRGELTSITSPTEAKVTFNKGWAEDAPTGAVYFTSQLVDNTTTLSWFDQQGRVIREDATAFDGSKVYKYTEYNAKGQLMRESMPHQSGNIIWTSYTYDNLNRINTITGPDGVTTYTYAGVKTTVTHSGMGVSKSTIVGAGGQTIEASDPGGTILYKYNHAGQVKEIWAPGNIITWMKYDDYGNQIELEDPSAGKTKYTYNAYGELTQHEDARGKMYNLTYDNGGRVLTKAGNSDLISYTYDPQTGMLSSTSGLQATYKYQYDQYYRLTRQDEIIDGTTLVYRQEYDQYNRVTKATYPGGFAVTNQYQNGYLKAIRRSDTNGLIWEGLNTNTMGQFTRYKAGNGLTTEQEYTPEGFLRSTLTGSVQHLAYEFDASKGVLNNREDKLRGLKEVFMHDNLSRLTSAQVGTHPALTMQYGPKGNMVSKSDMGTMNYQTTNKPYQVSAVVPNTGLLSDQTQQITYTGFNKVATISKKDKVAAFEYGPDESRVLMRYSLNGSEVYKRIYGAGYEKTIQSNGDTRELTYIATPSGMTAVFEKMNGTGGSLFYIYPDHLGSPHTITKANGSLEQVVSYDAWGNLRNATTWTSEGLAAAKFYRGFTGHEHLEEFALINMNGRIYDPNLGVFLSPDPYVQAPGFTQNYNRYAYCMNSPLKFTDPTGYQVQEPIPRVYKYMMGGGVLSDDDIDKFDRALLNSIHDYNPNRAAFGGAFERNAALRAASMQASQVLNKTHFNVPEYGRWVTTKIHFTKGGESVKDNLSSSGYAYTSIGVTIYITTFVSVPAANGGGISVPYVLGGMENSAQALSHYFNGNGTPATLGNNTINALVLSNGFQTRHQRIISGKTTSLTGSFSVNLTGSVFHVGRTNVDYSIGCTNGNCTVTYDMFVRDGFWDPDFIDEYFMGRLFGEPLFQPDGPGPNLERFGGAPYPYNPVRGTYTFPNPGY